MIYWFWFIPPIEELWTALFLIINLTMSVVCVLKINNQYVIELLIASNALIVVLGALSMLLFFISLFLPDVTPIKAIDLLMAVLVYFAVPLLNAFHLKLKWISPVSTAVK